MNNKQDSTSTEKPKKKFYKRWSFWVALLILFAILGNENKREEKKSSESSEPKTEEKADAPKHKSAPKKKSSVPLEYQNCLDDANNYLESESFSKKGLRDQLKSKDGDNYPEKAVDYAMSHIKVNWNEQAYKAAKDYQDAHVGGSRKEMLDQLTSSYGDGFTKSQAQYAVNKLYNK